MSFCRSHDVQVTTVDGVMNKKVFIAIILKMSKSEIGCARVISKISK